MMQIVARATAIFFFVLILLRLMRKRSLGEMTPLQMILLVVIGDLVQQGVTQEDYSVTGAVFAIATFAFWITVFDWISWRSGRARRFVEGVPIVVIEDGEPVEAALKLELVPWEEVLESARQKGIDDIRDVRLGVLETDGHISFITRSPQ